MTFAASDRTGTSDQRGFWLRCFLGNALLALAVLPGRVRTRLGPKSNPRAPSISGVCTASSSTPKAIRSPTSPSPSRATTSSSPKPPPTAMADFAFDHVYGHFQLHIDRTHYSPLDREVIVGIETAELSRKMLYVIAGPGACTDDCSSVFTNKNEFQKTIHRNTQHNY